MTMAIECTGLCKHYSHFDLSDVDLSVPTGSVMGFVGPNGAGKSTTMRILMGLVTPNSGEVNVLGHRLPFDMVEVKRNTGYVSEDMRLYGSKNLQFHMDFVRSMYDTWDDKYADELIKRFKLPRDQKTNGFSHGQRVKAFMLLALARRPKLLILDEPTTGLDPAARHEILNGMMEVLQDETRSILFSSHNTLDVEQISDHIAFILDGRIVDTNDKETFLDNWRRIRLELPEDAVIDLPHVVSIKRSGKVAILETDQFAESMMQSLKDSACVKSVDRMTLEEIFLSRVIANPGSE